MEMGGQFHLDLGGQFAWIFQGVKQQQVLSQYIDQYIPIIDKTLIAIRENKENLHIPYAQFLFSEIDYYGLIYIAATKRSFSHSRIIIKNMY